MPMSKTEMRIIQQGIAVGKSQYDIDKAIDKYRDSSEFQESSVASMERRARTNAQSGWFRKGKAKVQGLKEQYDINNADTKKKYEADMIAGQERTKAKIKDLPSDYMQFGEEMHEGITSELDIFGDTTKRRKRMVEQGEMSKGKFVRKQMKDTAIASLNIIGNSIGAIMMFGARALSAPETEEKAGEEIAKAVVKGSESKTANWLFNGEFVENPNLAQELANDWETLKKHDPEEWLNQRANLTMLEWTADILSGKTIISATKAGVKKGGSVTEGLKKIVSTNKAVRDEAKNEILTQYAKETGLPEPLVIPRYVEGKTYDELIDVFEEALETRTITETTVGKEGMDMSPEAVSTRANEKRSRGIREWMSGVPERMARAVEENPTMFQEYLHIGQVYKQSPNGRTQLPDGTFRTEDTILGHAGKRVGTTEQLLKDMLNDTGSRIGEARKTFAETTASPEQFDAIEKSFFNELDKLKLTVTRNKNGKLLVVRTPDTVLGVGSKGDIPRIQEFLDELEIVRNNPTLENIIDYRAYLDKRARWGKKATETSEDVIGFTKGVRHEVNEINKQIIGADNTQALQQYSDVIDVLHSLQDWTNRKKGAEYLMRSVKTGRADSDRAMLETVRQLTGVDLVAEANMMALAIRLVDDGDQTTALRAIMKDAGIGSIAGLAVDPATAGVTTTAKWIYNNFANETKAYESIAEKALRLAKENKDTVGVGTAVVGGTLLLNDEEGNASLLPGFVGIMATMKPGQALTALKQAEKALTKTVDGMTTGLKKLPEGSPEAKAMQTKLDAKQKELDSVIAERTKIEADPDFKKGENPSKLPTTVKKKEIVQTDPILNTKNEITFKDVSGAKITLPKGTALTPYILENGNVLIKNGKEYVIKKSAYDNIVNQSLRDIVPTQFAPELEGMSESVYGQGHVITRKDRETRLKELDDFRKAKESKYGTTQSYEWSHVDQNKLQELQDFVDNDGPRDKPTKFQNWSESNKNKGENYSEILVIAPETPKNLTPEQTFKVRERDYDVDVDSDSDEGVKHYGVWRESDDYEIFSTTNKAEADEYLREQEGSTVYGKFEKGYTGGHWSDNNVVTHLRGFDTKTAGGEKVFFADEFQSDWMLALRRDATRIAEGEGLKGKKAIDARVSELIEEHKAGTRKKIEELPSGYKIKSEKTDLDEGEFFILDKEGMRMAHGETEDEAVSNAMRILNIGIETPYNPALDNWLDTSIKRGLVEAVNRDAEYFAWTNSTQQKARYSLSKVVDDISWGDNIKTKTGSMKDVSVNVKNGSHVVMTLDETGMVKNSNNQRYVGSNIDEVVPKEIANNIMRDETGRVSGEGLDIGGKWTVALYDQQVPNKVKDMTGAEIEELPLGMKSNVKTRDLDVDGDVDVDVPDDLDPGETVSYFGEDMQVMESNVPGDNGPGYLAIPESEIEGSWDVDQSISEWIDSEHDNWFYDGADARDEFVYHSEWTTKEVERTQKQADGTYNFKGDEYIKVSGKNWGGGQDADTKDIVKVVPVEAFDHVIDGVEITREDIIDFVEGKLLIKNTQKLFEKADGNDLDEILKSNTEVADGDWFFEERGLEEGSRYSKKYYKNDLDTYDLARDIVRRDMDDGPSYVEHMQGMTGENNFFYDEANDKVVRVSGDVDELQQWIPYGSNAEDVAEEAVEEGAEKITGEIQQGIKLTPEIKARIKGEKPPLALPEGSRPNPEMYALPLLLLYLQQQSQE